MAYALPPDCISERRHYNASAREKALILGYDRHGAEKVRAPFLKFYNTIGAVIFMWVANALLSAFFAALTSILAKIGIENVNSNLATAIRTAVVLIMAWGITFATGKHHEIAAIGQKSWAFLALSGIATGLSWLFYYRALQVGDASKVVPIDKLSVVISMILAFAVLHERADMKTVLGGALITAGTFVLIR
jgi:transporter family protein